MRLLERRVRGFRLVDLVGLSLLVMIILGVYLAKTIAGRERAEIATIERQIKSEKARIRLLQAEVAHLEQPGRIERLSTAYLGLQPASLKREVTDEGLAEVVRKDVPAPMQVAAPASHPAAMAPPAAVQDSPILLAEVQR